MNIEIDWSISDDDSESPPLPEEVAPVAPLTASGASSSLRLRWRRLGLVLAALVVLLAGGSFAIRAVVEEGQRRLETSLRDAVALEIGAIRAEDRELFLSLQDPADGGWVALQDSAFPGFRALGIIPHEVTQVEMLGDRAWVNLRMTRPGWGEVQTTWAYRRLDDSWRHTRLDENWWGPRTIFTSGSVKVIFFARDEAAAHDLLGRAINWLYHACTDFGCDGLPSVTIDITNSLSLPPDSITWVTHDLLSFPSPHAGWGRPGGLPPEAMVEDLALQLVRKAIYSRRGLADLGPARRPDDARPGDARPQITLAEQAAAWEVSKWGMGAAPPPANYVAVLAAQYGPSAVRNLIAVLGTADSVESALTTALSTSFTTLDRSPDFFALLLNAEADAVHRRDRATFLALQDLNISGWRRVQINRYDAFEAWMATDAEILNRFRRRSTNDRIVVIRARLIGPRGPVERLEAFRWANNRWVHTWPAFEAWGEKRAEDTPRFRVIYHERDADLVHPLLPQLDDLYRRIAADLGLPLSSRPLTITVDPVAADYRGLPNMVVPSPWTMGLPVADRPDAGSAFLLREIVTLMVYSLARQSIPAEMSLSQEAALSALVEWEVRSVLGEPLLDAEARSELEQALARDRLLPLNTLWATPVLVRPSFGQPATLGWSLARAEWLTLLDYLAGRAGSLPALLEFLPSSASLEDWLQRSLGMRLADVDAGWRAALKP